MTEEPLRSDDAAVADVIRSFTDAEVALREIAAAAAESRAAVDALEDSEARMDAAQASLNLATEAIGDLANGLAETSRSLGATAGSLGGFRPERLHEALVAIRDDNEALVEAIGSESAQRASADAEALAALTDIRQRLAAVAEDQEKLSTRLALVGIVAAAALIGVVAVLVMLLVQS